MNRSSATSPSMASRGARSSAHPAAHPAAHAPARATRPRATTAASQRLLALLASLALAACATSPPPGASGGAAAAGSTAGAAPACKPLPMSDARRTAVSAGVGAFLGGIVGASSGKHRARNAAGGALVGALVGALASSAFKNEIDVEEQDDGSVRLKIPGSIMFASGRDDLSAGFQSTLASVAGTIRQYCDLGVRVVGHTDSIGSPASNQALSERRAASVGAYLRSQGVDRITTAGRGQHEPVADNAHEAGRQANRRVEVFVRPPVQ
jgi:outer membrane protein OmpA-like peptidoglycan-associated protein